MWYDFLRIYPIRFLRQKILGKYIVEFYCAEAQLIVESDGSQHYENKWMEYDTGRTAYPEQYGVRVLRIPENEVNQSFPGYVGISILL